MTARARRPYPVVLITLDAEQVVPWARQQWLPPGIAELAVHPAVRALIEPVVARVNALRAQVAQVIRRPGGRLWQPGHMIRPAITVRAAAEPGDLDAVEKIDPSYSTDRIYRVSRSETGSGCARSASARRYARSTRAPRRN